MTELRTITIQNKNQIGYSYEAPTNADEAWELIKFERQLRSREGGYKVGDHWYHSDKDSKVQQIGLVIMGSNMPPNLMWKTMDGNFVQMTPALAQQIFQTAAYVESLIFNKAEEKRQQVMASGDFANFDYFGGWPTAFWEAQ